MTYVSDFSFSDISKKQMALWWTFTIGFVQVFSDAKWSMNSQLPIVREFARYVGITIVFFNKALNLYYTVDKFNRKVWSPIINE